MTAGSKEGEPPKEALLARLRQFVEDSDVSFYKIASDLGASGSMLSMWLAGRVAPSAEKLFAIEKILEQR
jgi:transcriptional regulator with XRE-family HTH domain